MTIYLHRAVIILMNSLIFLPQVFFSVAFKLFHCIVLHLAGDKKNERKKTRLFINCEIKCCI